MKTKSKRYGFTIFQERRDRSHYAHLHVVVQPVGYNSNPGTLTFRFQTDDEKRQDGFPGWYGRHIRIEADYPAEISVLARILSKVEKALDKRETWKEREMTPENLMSALASLKIPLMVFDGRTSEYTPIPELPDPFVNPLS